MKSFRSTLTFIHQTETIWYSIHRMQQVELVAKIFLQQKKTATGWTKAKSIGNLINTKAEESSPRFSRDGKYFFFGRESRTNPEKDGIWSIYYIETKALKITELFKD